MGFAIQLSRAALIACGLAGCMSPQYADAPTPTRFQRTDQLKLQSAAHWRVIAEHFATQMTKDLQAKQLTRPVFITSENGDFAFVEGFRELLTTSLVNQGVEISTVPEGADKLEIRYAAYRFDNNRTYDPKTQWLATLLVGGAWALEGLVVSQALNVKNWDSLIRPGLLGGAAILDWQDFQSAKQAKGAFPKTEIVLTASLQRDNRIVARRSNVYFTADEDAALYWQKTGKTANRGVMMPVRGE